MDESNNNRRHAYYVCVLIYKQISERTVVGELCALFYTLSFMHTNFNFGWIVSFRFLYLFSLCICLGCDFLYIPLVHMSYFALIFFIVHFYFYFYFLRCSITRDDYTSTRTDKIKNSKLIK
jgi:hypothetical protein